MDYHLHAVVTQAAAAENQWREGVRSDPMELSDVNKHSIRFSKQNVQKLTNKLDIPNYMAYKKQQALFRATNMIKKENFIW